MGTPRCSAPFQFENLNPPWVLAQLDSNNVNQTNAINDSSLGASNFVALDTGGVNSYAIASTEGVSSAYNVGMQYTFIPTNTNTGPSVINVDGLGSKSIVYPNTSPLIGFEIIAGCAITLQFDGTNMRIVTLNRWPIYKTFGIVTTAQSVQCAGGSSIAVYYTVTSAVTVSMSLNQLCYGAVVNLFAANSSGSPRTFPVFASDPAGTVATLIFQSLGTHSASPPSIPSNQFCFYDGTLLPGPTLFLRALVG